MCDQNLLLVFVTRSNIFGYWWVLRLVDDIVYKTHYMGGAF